MTQVRAEAGRCDSAQRRRTPRIPKRHSRRIRWGSAALVLGPVEAKYTPSPQYKRRLGKLVSTPPMKFRDASDPIYSNPTVITVLRP